MKSAKLLIKFFVAVGLYIGLQQLIELPAVKGLLDFLYTTCQNIQYEATALTLLEIVAMSQYDLVAMIDSVKVPDATRFDYNEPLKDIIAQLQWTPSLSAKFTPEQKRQLA